MGISNVMKKIKTEHKFIFILMFLMMFYVFIPCILQAAPSSYKSVNMISQTASITYFYNGSTLMNAEDDNGDMSTYLDRSVRTIVNVNTQAVVDTQCLFTDGKNVISQTNSTGTTVTSTQQYNAFGQLVNYNNSPSAFAKASADKSTTSHESQATSNDLSLSTNPFQYDGYYYDPESSLYYLNARYYSPTLMQFISMDSYDLANRYGYCDGNPIGNEDPSGHFPLFLMFSKFAEKVLRQYLNPLQMDGNTIGTSPTDIITDAVNLSTELLTGGTEELELKLIEYPEDGYESAAENLKTEKGVPEFFKDEFYKDKTITDQLLDRSDTRSIDDVIKGKGFFPNKQHPFLDPDILTMSKNTTKDEYNYFKGTSGQTSRFGVSTGSIKMENNQWRNGDGNLYMLTYNNKGFYVEGNQFCAQGEINLPYGIDAKHIVGYYDKAENKGYKVTVDKNYEATLEEINNDNNNNFNNGSTFAAYFRAEYIKLFSS